MYYFDTTVFVDTRLWKTKHPRKHFQNFRQSCVLLTDRIEIHQSPPYSMTWRRLEGHTGGSNWWISIRSVNNTQDWLKFWKRFRRCFVFQSCVSTKTAVIVSNTAIQLQVNLRAGGVFLKGRSLNIGREGMVASINKYKQQGINLLWKVAYTVYQNV